MKSYDFDLLLIRFEIRGRGSENSYFYVENGTTDAADVDAKKCLGLIKISQKSKSSV